MPLDKHQQAVLDDVLQFTRFQRRQEYQVQGRAGTGKTTLIASLARELECPVLAPTNKAAAVLRSKGIIAQTAHSYLYLPSPAGTPAQIEEAKTRLAAAKPRSQNYATALQDLRDLKRLTFILKPMTESAPVVVVDESSMIPTRLGEDLTNVAPQVIAFGDPWQLPPVNARAYFTDEPDATLKKVYRQGRGSGILDMAFDAYTTGRPSTYSTSARVLSGYKLTRDRYVARLGVADKILVGTHFTRRLLNHVLRYERGLPPVPVEGDTLTCVRSPSMDERDAGLTNGYSYDVVRVGLIEQGASISLHLKDVLSGELVKFVMSTRHFLLASLPLKPGAPSDVDDGPPLDFDHAVTTHKCCHPDTLVETPGGLSRIADLPPTGQVATPFRGMRPYLGKVEYASGAALKITCEDGYNETVTPDHKMEVCRDGRSFTKLANEVVIGDWMRVRLGVTGDPLQLSLLPPLALGDVRAVTYRTPQECTAACAEFFGLMVADGTIYAKGFRLLKRHRDVALRFRKLCRILFGIEPRSVAWNGATGFEVNSVLLAEWLRTVGGMSPKAKAVPSVILSSPLDIQGAFLRGLFEDGSAHLNRSDGVTADSIQYSTAVPELAQMVHTLLLRFGIIANLTAPQRGIRQWSVYIYGRDCGLFRDSIGFVSSFKNGRLASCLTTDKRHRVPLSEAEIVAVVGVSMSDRNNVRQRGYATRGKLRQWIAEGNVELREKLEWHWVRVRSIERTRCSSVCIEVPDGHRFLQNGFPHGNSQGSEWPAILVQDESSVFGPHRKRWLYTAITRAIASCVVVQGRPELKPPPRSYTKEYI